jgi:hypothetical protein
MSYNPRSGNPFTQCDPNKEWTDNNLILQDPKLRSRSGVTVLDHNVSEMFPCKDLSAVSTPATQSGGGSVGAPFWNQKGPQAAEEGQLGGGSLPYHYFNNNKKW